MSKRQGNFDRLQCHFMAKYQWYLLMVALKHILEEKDMSMNDVLGFYH